MKSRNNYLLQHWRGELSLSVSYLVNLVLLTAAIRVFAKLLDHGVVITHPQIAARLGLIYFLMHVVVIYPWQVVGVWRAANRHVVQTNRALWPRIAQIVIVVGLLVTVNNLRQYWPTYKEMYTIGFHKDPYATYKITLEKNGSLIHLQGGLGFGASHAVATLLKQHPNVEGIILDSGGGRMYEGLELGTLIAQHALNTYSLQGCYSACTTAFVAGTNRYIGLGANLAFHQPTRHYSQVDFTEKAKRSVIERFQEQGVANHFIAKMFGAANDDYWYPSVEELREAHVIHEVVQPSDVMPVQYADNEFAPAKLESELQKLSFYRVIKKYDPGAYEQMLTEFHALIEKGASRVEIQRALSNYAWALADKAMAVSSDDALVNFARISIAMLKELEHIDPFLCLKSLFPSQYGSLSYTQYVAKDTQLQIMDVLSQVITDSYEKTTPPVDAKAADAFLVKVEATMGDRVLYLEPRALRDKADYKKACDAFIELYALILDEEKHRAGNVLRSLFLAADE